MKRNSSVLFILLIALATHVFAGNPKKKIAGYTKSEILKIADDVAQWELKKEVVLSDGYGGNKNGWVMAPFWAGLMDLHKFTRDVKYYKIIEDFGNSIQWEPGAHPYDANAHCISATFCDMYEFSGDEKMVAKARFMADMPINRRHEPTVKFKGNSYWIEWWTWCDALFMAPPTYARLGAVLKNKKYTDYMSENWWRTSDYLYNKKDSLFFRDDTFFEFKEPNGEHRYWSRGNGWVIGGLCRVMDYLPEDYPTRERFENQFAEMAIKLASIQTEEGYWSTSLLDYNTFPGKETSGTAFFCYALAWGVNNGLLDKKEFMPYIEKAWKSLTDAVHEDGMLGYVQKIGHEPGSASPDDEQSYGAGAFLLAAVELLKME